MVIALFVSCHSALCILTMLKSTLLRKMFNSVAETNKDGFSTKEVPGGATNFVD